jgi:hypothetical protein
MANPLADPSAHPAGSSIDPSVAPPRRLLLRLWPLWLLCLLTATVLALPFGLLFTTGIPLHPAVRWFQPQIHQHSGGLAITLESGWLVADRHGSVRLQLSGLHIADTAGSPLVAWREFQTAWQLRDLLAKAPLPRSLTIRGLSLHLAVDAAGRPIPPALPAFQPAAPAPAGPPLLPSQLPAILWPRANQPFSLHIVDSQCVLHTLSGERQYPLPDLAIDYVLQAADAVLSGRLFRDPQAPWVTWRAGIDPQTDRVTWQHAVALTLDSALINQWAAFANMPPQPAAPPLVIAHQLDVVLDLAQFDGSPHSLNVQGSAHTTVDTGQSTLTASFELSQAAGSFTARSSGAIPAWQDLLARVPSAWLPMRAEGDYGWTLDATGMWRDGVPQLLAATASAHSSGITVMGGPLPQPLVIAPFAVTVQVAEGGDSGSMAPATLQLGPLGLATDGISWQRSDGTWQVRGNGRLLPVGAAAILPWLAPLLPQLPPSLIASIELCALQSAELSFTAHGIGLPSATNLPALSALATVAAKVGADHPDLTLRLRFPNTQNRLELKLDVAPLEPAAWQLPVFNKLPVPDMPIACSVLGIVDIAKRQASVEWALTAGPGTLSADPWLRGSLPVGPFAIRGMLSGPHPLHCIVDGELTVDASTAGFTLQLESDHLTMGQPLALRSVLDFSLHHLEPGPWLDRVAESYRPSLPVERAILDRIGLTQLIVSGASNFTLDPASASLTLQSLNASIAPELRIDTTSISPPATLDWEAEGQTLMLKCTLPPVTPATFEPLLPVTLPVTLASIDLPLSGALTIRQPLPATWPSILVPDPRVLGTLHIGPGSILPSPLLAAPITVQAVSISLEALPLTNELSSLTLTADLADGPRLQLSASAHMRDGKLRATVDAGLANLALPWMLARVPPARLPEAVATLWPQLDIAGNIDHAQLKLGVEWATNSPPHPDIIRDLHLDVAGSAFGLHYANFPRASLAALSIIGNRDSLVMKLHHAATTAANCSLLSVTLQQPLSTSPSIAWSAAATLDCDPLPTLVASLTGDPAPPAWASWAQGSVPITFSGTAQPGSADAPAVVDWQLFIDLTPFGFDHPAIQPAKRPGTPARVDHTLRATIASGLAAADIAWQLGIDHLVFDEIRLAGTLGLSPTQPGLHQLRHLSVDTVRWDRSHGSVSLIPDWPNDNLAIRAVFPFIDLPPLLNRIEPALLAALAPATPANDQAAATTPPPATPAEPPAAPPTRGLPSTLSAAIAINHLELATGRRWFGFTIDAQSKGLSPSAIASARLAFQADDNAVQLTLDPAVGAELPHRFNLQVGNVAALARDALAAVATLSPAALDPALPLAGLLPLPALIAGGELAVDGQLAIDPVTLSGTQLSLTGLTLETEVAFLSRIAALVNRSVLLRIPFERFSVGDARYSALGIEVHNFEMKGPIDLAIETVTLSPANELFVRGKVFGICFEVAGPLANPSFYLCEKPALKLLSSEDDFDW